MNGRRLKMSIPADFVSVDLVRSALQGICREIFEPAGGPFTAEIALAVTEVMNNAVEHSESATIEMELVAMDRTGITLRLIDEGRPFDPTVPASMPDQDEWGAEGGYGLALVQQLVDTLEYEFRDGKNILILSKTFMMGKEA